MVQLLPEGQIPHRFSQACGSGTKIRTPRSSCPGRLACLPEQHSSPRKARTGGDSFYELSARLAAVYERAQERCGDLCAENATLRADLAQMSTQLRRMKEIGKAHRPNEGTFENGDGDEDGGELNFGAWSRRELPKMPRTAASYWRSSATPQDTGATLAAVSHTGRHAGQPDLLSPSSSSRAGVMGGLSLETCPPDAKAPPPDAKAPSPAVGSRGAPTPLSANLSGGSSARTGKGRLSPASLSADTTDARFIMPTTPGSEEGDAACKQEGVDEVFAQSGAQDSQELLRRASKNSKITVLSMRELWEEDPFSARRRKGSLQVLTGNEPLGDESREIGTASMRTGDVIQERSCLQKWVMRPTSRPLIFWDIITTVIVIYDLIVIPLAAFDLQSVAFTVLDWVTATMWSFDIFVNFMRGVDIGGVVELRPSRIMARYLKSWFPLDILTVTVDWVVLMFSMSGDLEVLQNLRMRRLMRIVRIVRLIRLVRVMNRDTFKDLTKFYSEHVGVLLNILKLLIAIWVVNHYVACGWYAIGNIYAQDTWVRNNKGANDKLYAYTTALHWSFTQFTPASMEVVPENSLERIYTVTVIVFGMVMFSSFISQMSSAIMYFKHLNLEEDKRNRMLRRFMIERRVSLELMGRVNTFLRSSKTTANMRLHEKEVLSLKMCPQTLLRRLHDEMYSPHLIKHPLMNKLKLVDSSAIVSICHLAMTERRVHMGEELFRTGMRASCMYFVVAGTASYFPGYEEYCLAEVTSGHWLCEMVLWTNWDHRGRLTTLSLPVEVLELEAAEFQTILCRSLSIPQVQRYAQLYCSRAAVNCQGRENITDLWGSKSQVGAMVHCAFDYGKENLMVNQIVMMWDDSKFVAFVFAAWAEFAMNARADNQSQRGTNLWCFAPWKWRWR